MGQTRTLFIASSSQLGGAEKQLLLLLEKLKANQTIALCILDPSGEMNPRYQNLGITTYLSQRGPINNCLAIHQAVKDFQPDTVVNWLYKADILGGFIAKAHRVNHIVNSARNIKWVKFAKWKMALLVLAEKLTANHVISNSEDGKNFHIRYGYSAKKFTVIENFLDTNLIALPKLPDQVCTIGIASRATEGKGHFEVINLLEGNPDLAKKVQLSFIGPGIPEWQPLVSRLERSNLRYELHSYSSDLSGWFQKVDLYAALSTLSESDSSSLLDAVLTLTPIISSPIQNFRKLSPQPPVVDPEERDELAQALNSVLDGDIEKAPELLARRENLLDTRGDEAILAKWERILNG